MFSLEQFKEKFKNSLESKKSELIATLNELTKNSFNPRIEIFEFQAFIEPTRYEIDIRLFLMDEEWNEIFNNGEETDYIDSSLDVLKNLIYFDFPFDQIDEKYFEEMDKIINEGLTAFVSGVYDQSVFSKIEKKTYFYIHDEVNNFDLRNKNYIQM